MSLEVAKSITKNTAIMMGSQIITWVSSFVLMLFLPRYLGSVDYGRMYLAMSVTVIFEIVIDFGGRYAVTKDISRSREAAAQILTNAMAIRAVLWVIVMAALMVFMFVAGYPPEVRILIIIFGFAMLNETARKVLYSGYQGFELMKYPALGNIVERVFTMVFGVAALLLGAPVYMVALILVAGEILNFAICVRNAGALIPRIPSVDWKSAVASLKEALPYFLWSIFGIIYYRVDAVMLSLMTSDEVVGWYGAAYRFFDILMFLPSIFSIAVLPVMSRLWKQEQSTMALTTRKSVEYIVFAAIPVSISIFFFSNDIIHLFFGLEEYTQSVRVLQIFSAGLMLVYVDIILGTAILASDKQKAWSITAFFAVLLNIGLNWFMIPFTQTHYGNGGLGAAIATIITEFYVMIVAIIIIPRSAYSNGPVTMLLKSLAGGVVMSLAVIAMQSLPLHWIGQAILSIVVYLLVCLLMKVLEPQELEFIRNAVKIRNLRTVLVPRDRKADA
jgi:O-antigen/teichoic acid export membrane protein